VRIDTAATANDDTRITIQQYLIGAYGDVGTDEALRDFMATKTYQLLMNPKSFLFLESPAYIVDMITAEQSGNRKFCAVASGVSLSSGRDSRFFVRKTSD
jgi:hypothetical protein